MVEFATKIINYCQHKLSQSMTSNCVHVEKLKFGTDFGPSVVRTQTTCGCLISCAEFGTTHAFPAQVSLQMPIALWYPWQFPVRQHHVGHGYPYGHSSTLFPNSIVSAWMGSLF